MFEDMKLEMISEKTTPLQDYVTTSKYANWVPHLKRRETYEEAVNRMMDMHATFYKGKGVEKEIEFARKAVLQRRALGSMRALQFGGSPILRKNARIYNCCVSLCDRPRFFQEFLWASLCGCGVGFSVQKQHVAKLPTVRRIDPTKRTTFIIPDTIEGWSDAVGALMSSYFTKDQPFPEVFGKYVEFDYSKIRPAGALISSGVGKAPGPDPLRRSLELIRTVIDKAIAESGKECKLRPIHYYDVLMHEADASVSGGVRRSATTAIFSPDDEEMATAKIGNWFAINPQRARSNNSAALLRKVTSFEQFNKFIQYTKQFGEPGFLFVDSLDIIFNPCYEIAMLPIEWVSGKTGFQFCNLSTINGRMCLTQKEARTAVKAAAILGTLQAGYTNFDYLGETSELITKREALLGVSITGLMDSPSILLDPIFQQELAQDVLDVNKVLAKKLGINACARGTCIKPEGSVSCVLNTASGVHPHHSKRYFRRVQANKLEEPYQLIKELNPRNVEDSVWNPNGSDGVVTFCVDVQNKDAIIKNDLSALDLLEKVKLTQQNWVTCGKRTELCTHEGLQHNVSNTINVKPNEWDIVSQYIFDNRKYFTAVSLLPESGELDYPQAPFVDVWTYDAINKHYGVGSLFASGLIVDGLHAFGDLWEACACTLGMGKELIAPKLTDFPDGIGQRELFDSALTKLLLKKDWIRRAKKFAFNYFKDDLREMTYCLKRVHNCKLWEDLQREWQPVDYTKIVELENNTKLNETVACAGGQCQII